MLYDNGPLAQRPSLPGPSGWAVTPSGNGFPGPINPAGKSKPTYQFNLKNPQGNLPGMARQPIQPVFPGMQQPGYGGMPQPGWQMPNPAQIMRQFGQRTRGLRRKGALPPIQMPGQGMQQGGFQQYQGPWAPWQQYGQRPMPTYGNNPFMPRVGY